MKRNFRLVAYLLVLIMILTACTTQKTETPSQASSSTEPVATSSATTQASSAATVSTGNPLFTYETQAGTTADIASWYAKYGVTSNVSIRQKGGTVKVTDDEKVTFPTPKKQYTIGFSVYYTVDEVGSMYLASMKEAAKEAGINLLVNDANYDQNAQNQAIEQWILQGVDGVIMTPCDFTGCKTVLDELNKAKIPVITIDAPPLVGTVDAMVVYDCVEQGVQSGTLLKDAITKAGKDLNGTIVYDTLPFEHPNATTRLYGFKSVFKDSPNVKFKELTGESPEEHYTVFEGAIQSNPDMLGAWGLYDSATIGMLNAMKAENRTDIPLSSVDNDRTILASISKGEILGTSGYSAIVGSRWGLYLMISLLNGDTVPGILWQQNTLVTKNNVPDMFKAYYNGATLEDYLAGKK